MSTVHGDARHGPCGKRTAIGIQLTTLSVAGFVGGHTDGNTQTAAGRLIAYKFLFRMAPDAPHRCLDTVQYA